MFTPYYNYRPIDLETAQSLYPGWEIGTMHELTEDGLIAEKPHRFTIGCRTTCPVYHDRNLALDVSLDGHLLIELSAYHWFEYENPLNKFQRGPYAEADVGYDAHPTDSALKRMGDMLTNGRVRYGHNSDDWRDPTSFLPVTLWVAGHTKLSHFVEAGPHEATHVLYYYEGDLPRLEHCRSFKKFFNEGTLACCRGKGFGVALAELDPPPRTISGHDEDPLRVTNFRVALDQAQAAFQRKVGPTCPSTTFMRLRGAAEHGFISIDD